MGTGAVKGHCNPSSTTDTRTSSTSNSDPRSSISQQQQANGHGVHSSNHTDNIMKMSCELCSTNFTLFKRKKFCQECHRYFCSTCLPKPPSSSPTGRQCSKCRLLISGNFTRGDLRDWKVKDIRCFLDVRMVSTKGCREKHDLVELVLSQFCTERRNSLELKAEHEVLVQQMAAHLTDNTGNDAASTSVPGSEEASGGPSGTDTEVNALPWNEESVEEARQDTMTNLRDEGDGSGSGGDMSSGAGIDHNQESHPGGESREPTDTPRYTSLDREQLRNYLEEQVREILQLQIAHAAERVNQESPAPLPDQPSIPRFHLEDVKTLEEIESLTGRQLKQLLVNNFVDFKGCCEKSELVLRVKRLWNDHQENKMKAERIHEADEFASSSTHQDNKEANVDTAVPPSSTTNAPTSSDNDLKLDESSQPSASLSPSKTVTEEPSHSLCRVCMDSLTDCILLECGHMVTCTTCGKQLAECPICRQYISRVVRVFRS